MTDTEKQKECDRIGLRIAEIRKEHGLTQTELANMTGLGQGHIARIEQGKYNIQIDTLGLIAEAFGMTIDFVRK